MRLEMLAAQHLVVVEFLEDNNMAAYGKGQMLGSGINPESFKQDYSGFSRAAEMQAQGLSNLGGSIAGAIKDFGETKKEEHRGPRRWGGGRGRGESVGHYLVTAISEE